MEGDGGRAREGGGGGKSRGFERNNTIEKCLIRVRAFSMAKLCLWRGGGASDPLSPCLAAPWVGHESEQARTQEQ